MANTVTQWERELGGKCPSLALLWNPSTFTLPSWFPYQLTGSQSWARELVDEVQKVSVL